LFYNGRRGWVTFQAPANHYPLEVLRVGILWRSVVGIAVDSLESGIDVYAGGLPDPGTRILTFDFSTLVDGSTNEFDLEPLPGEARIESGPFTVTLEFLNTQPSPTDPCAPFTASVVADAAAAGCRAGRNVSFAVPGGGADACPPGVTGDWVMRVVYRKLECGGLQLPGDCNQDGSLDLSDAVCALGVLFNGTPPLFPCGDGGATAPGNIALLDWQPDGSIDLSDAVGILQFLFFSAVAHPLAVPGSETTECVVMSGCAANSNCPRIEKRGWRPPGRQSDEVMK
jgi:hypothetical protein